VPLPKRHAPLPSRRQREVSSISLLCQRFLARNETVSAPFLASVSTARPETHSQQRWNRIYGVRCPIGDQEMSTGRPFLLRKSDRSYMLVYEQKPHFAPLILIQKQATRHSSRKG